MRCDHFDAGTCHSCTLLDIPHDRQVASSRHRIEELLAPFTLGPRSEVWGSPIVSAEAGFRNKAKMVVTGTAADPVLGIAPQSADPLLGSEDLADCPLYPPGMRPVLEGVRALIRRAQVPPYDVARRRGELKNVLVTLAPDGRALVRLVLRSEAALGRIREHLGVLRESVPQVVTVSANIHPEHAATLEGDREIPLGGAEALDVTMGPVALRARDRSFLQTNTAVAGALYAQVAAWIDGLEQRPPLRIWDLYCGVGGFALACAGPGREVTGTEISDQAIVSARESAARLPDPGRLRFHAEDATTWAIAESGAAGPPDVVIVNPPRRGIGDQLAAWIEHSGVAHAVYSSCNPDSLARDLSRMPSLRIVRGRLVDMFPHTGHEEVAVLLARPDTDRSAA